MRIFSRSKLLLFVALCSMSALTMRADSILYTDGPINGTFSAFYVDSNSPFKVEDSFTLSSASTLTSVSFGNWLYRDDQALTVNWAIVGSEGSQTAVCAACSGTGTLTEGTTSFYNVQRYRVVENSFLLPNINLPAGTYWLELYNETTTIHLVGAGAAWDMNGGPSMVWNSGLGDVSGDNCTNNDNSTYPSGACSNAFTIYGTSNAVISGTPEPSTLALLGSGAALVATQVHRRRRRPAAVAR